MQICVRQPLFGSNEKSQLCVGMIVAYDPDELWEMLEKDSESALPFFCFRQASISSLIQAKSFNVPKDAAGL